MAIFKSAQRGSRSGGVRRGDLFATTTTLPTTATANSIFRSPTQWVTPTGSVWGDITDSGDFIGVEHIVSGSTAGSVNPASLAFPEGVDGILAVPTVGGVEHSSGAAFLPLGFTATDTSESRRISLGRGATAGSEYSIDVVYSVASDGQLTTRRLRLQFRSTSIPANSQVRFYYTGSGARGLQGIRGVQGLKGDRGQPGDKGDKGDPGDKGDKGDPGDHGDDGWTSLPAAETDGTRSVLRIVGYEGGTGTPPASGRYLGASGLVSTPAEAADVRGEPGDKGDKGDPGDKGDKGDPGDHGDDGADGTDGWTPVVAAVARGDDEVVLQVTDYTGGTGTKPTTGLYIGASGLTSNIADAINVKGADGDDAVTRATVLSALGVTQTQFDEWVVDATVTRDTLTLTKSDGDVVTYSPSRASGSGATDFTDLTDTPNDYTGDGGKYVAVKSEADGLEFVDAPSGGSTDWEDLTNFDDLSVVGTSGVGSGTNFPLNDGANKRISAGSLNAYIQGQLDLGGYLIPDGGTTGQVLAKRTNDDYATEWVDATAGGPTLEQIQDNLAGTSASPNTTGFLRAGNGISFTYSDTDDTFTINATGGSTPPPPTATFYAAVKTTKPFTATDFTGSTLPTYTGALPATFAIPGGTFTNTNYFGLWVPDTHPITSITEDGGGINQFGAFTARALTINTVAGTVYESNRLFLSDSAIQTWRLQ